MRSVSDVRLTPAAVVDAESGLVGYVTLRYGGLLLDGLTLRRKREGGLVISYPARRDRAGRDHPYLRPLDDATRREIESQVLQALGVSP